MIKYLVSFVLLVGCASNPVPAPQPTTPPSTSDDEDPHSFCVTVYEPHFCLVTVNTKTFAGHGSNKCEAIKKLKQKLIKNNHDPLLAEKAECGRVFE